MSLPARLPPTLRALLPVALLVLAAVLLAACIYLIGREAVEHIL